MLSMRGGRAAARTHKANGWEHQKRIAQISSARRKRLTLSKILAKLETEWPQVYGETLLEHLQTGKLKAKLSSSKAQTLRSAPAEGRRS